MTIYQVYKYGILNPKQITIEAINIDQLHSFRVYTHKTICHQGKDNHGMYEANLQAIFTDQNDLDRFCVGLNDN